MIHTILSFLLLINWLVVPEPTGIKQVGKGMHPSVSTDPTGIAHIVYGHSEVLYYTTSGTGEQFEPSVRVDSLPGLHLGASRGPQIAATNQSVVITALDKAGNVWAYTLIRATGQWQKRVRVNDIADIAKEGFVALVATPDNSYTAVWLDLRGDKQNKLVGSHSTDGGRTWSANKVLYQSPDGTICECCQVSAVSQGKHVALMFRNFLNGSRDMYLLTSVDGGYTFGKAEKMGEGTWKLRACPMDGGGLYMSPDGGIGTVWRRADKLYTARPGQPEIELATGKNAKIVTTRTGNYVVFQQAGELWVSTPNQPQPTAIGPGAYAKLTRLANDRILCLWDQDGIVQAKII
ncbi:sialidase family protein [Spirosoma flavum]|uniref:Sialidase family protein n=1 Tax=Spirosoma flavum TaxID=2048557 RepID=A0ABW6AIM4_9BACT